MRLINKPTASECRSTALGRQVFTAAIINVDMLLDCIVYTFRWCMNLLSAIN